MHAELGNSMFQDLTFGTYVSNGVSQFIPLAWVPSKFAVNVRGDVSGSNWNSVANPGVVKSAFAYSDTPAGSAYAVINTNGAATNQDIYFTSGGFSFYDASNPPVYPTVAITSVSQAAAAVVTTSAVHNLLTGDYVRFQNVTGMHQLDTLVFQVTVLSTTTFSITLDTSAFATAGSGGKILQLSQLNPMFPRNLLITSITQATNAVVTTSFDHGIRIPAPGVGVYAFLTFTITSPYGMVQLNDKLVKVLSVTANTLTLDLDTTGFTAFAYPTAGTVIVDNTPPQATPSGEIGQLFNAATNTSQYGILLGASIVGASGVYVNWEAYLGSPPVGS